MPSVSGFDPDSSEGPPRPDGRPASGYTCRHCMVWAEVREGEFAVICGHGCGRVQHSWISTDRALEARLADQSQQAFRMVHETGCPNARRPTGVPRKRRR